MNIWLRILMAVAALALPTPEAAANEGEPRLVLKPKSSWVLDYADENCGLRRMFGNGQAELLFELNATTPGHSYRLLLASEQLEVRRASPHIGFEPGPEPLEHAQASSITMEDGRRGYLSEISVLPKNEGEGKTADLDNNQSYDNFWLDKVETREKEIAGLGVGKGFDRDFFLEIDQFHPAMVAMRACQDDLVRSWGFDPSVLKTLSRPPMPKHQIEWARKLQRAYPSRMVMQGWGATIQVQLAVGADGLPSDCHVRADGQQDDFTETSCKILMKEARFEPALDADGKPTSALWTTRIIYRLR